MSCRSMGTSVVIAVAFIATLLLLPTHALYADDVGLFDFHVATAGHGPVTRVHALSEHGLVLTSSMTRHVVRGSKAQHAQCYVACRTADTGHVVWRRDVCQNRGTDNVARTSLDMTVVGTTVMTLETVATKGVWRGWNGLTGALVWDRVVAVDAVQPSELVARWDPTTHQWRIQMAVGESVPDGKKDRRRVVASFVWHPEQQSVPVWDETVTASSTVDSMDTAHASHWVPVLTNPPLTREVTCHGVTIAMDDKAPHGGPNAFRVQQHDDGTPPTNAMVVVPNMEHDMDAMALIQCTQDKLVQVITTSYQRGSTYGITIDVDQGTATVDWSHREGLALIASALQMDASHAADIDIATTDDTDGVPLATVEHWWTRWNLQWHTLVRLVGGTGTSAGGTSGVEALSRRDAMFGFGKIAILLSSACHAVYGMETFPNSQRVGLDRVRYQVDLSVEATWHLLLHGSNNRHTVPNDPLSRRTSSTTTTTTTATAPLGGVQGGAYTRDVLIVSYIAGSNDKEARLEWICMDGTTGVVRATGSRDLPQVAMVQIVPLTTNTAASCRQGALVLLADDSILAVTGDEVVATSATETSSTAVLYTHVLESRGTNANGSRLVSYGISPTLDTAHVVGSTLFAGEDIVAVAYPFREEVVHSPCDVLGDDSLLLKYLNPHLAVIVTMTNDTASDSATDFNLQTKTVKRKPVGVTPSGQSTGTGTDGAVQDTAPNLFVNVVDTVSGRIWHRSSHAHVVQYPRPTVLVSENWVFYSFVNGKTRKAELGVLSLYEGMIDKTGLTAFTSPEQATSFSSLEARDTKPVVLAKTFSLPMAVTALGMTATRSGISSRQLLLASVEGQIHAVDRKILEPRRPLGALKPHEKKEGLTQYHEWIPKISYHTLSYNLTVDAVQFIVTAPTDLESQSLVLAYGGPDLFFTRMSPSKAFDLLPDNFNKIVLSLVVVALIGALIVMQVLVSQKIKKAGWV